MGKTGGAVRASTSDNSILILSLSKDEPRDACFDKLSMRLGFSGGARSDGRAHPPFVTARPFAA